MTVRIESSANAVYKHIKKLQTKSGRSKHSQYLAEGVRAVRDAASNGADIEFVIVCEGFVSDFDLSGLKVYELSTRLFDTLKLTVNSQGIMAVINFSLPDVESADFSRMNTVVYLDSVTDPGNMGTIIRSCDALGADAIILSKGCVDIFNPKVVRSTMASIHNIPIYTDTTPEESFPKLKNDGFCVVGTFPTDATMCHKLNYSGKTLVVMGNEANGISDKVEALCDKRATIPMLGRAESLNVATALTVMLYEIMRNRIDN